MKNLHWMFVAAAVCLSGEAFSLRAATTCTTADYKGVYAFFTAGAFVQLPPEAALVQGPFSQAGTFTSDGQGNLVVDSTPSFNGFIVPSTSVVTYHPERSWSEHM